MECIFCNSRKIANSVEHIVPESFGNKVYVMQKGKVCDLCNGRFSKFEDTALTNSIFIMERARFGVETKKGQNAKGKINGLIIEGDILKRPNYLTVKGLTAENLKDFNPKTEGGHLVVSSFSKSEVAASKLVLKIGFESIYTSQRPIFKKYEFKELKDFLTTKTNNDWPFLITDFEVEKFRSVARFYHKFYLKNIHCDLKYLEVNESVLLFKFKYGKIAITLNLINRNLNWVKTALAEDSKATLFPEHFKNKLEKQKCQ